ncbi:MAG: amidohydrolase family protein [Rhodospirillales bacterium]|nr:amidohydrolase family protein [Rhodospirillales bacterium]
MRGHRILGMFLAGLGLMATPLWAQSSRPYIDVHAHLHGGGPNARAEGDFQGAAQMAMRTMGELGAIKMIVMPPPFPPDHPNSFDFEALLPIATRYPDKLAIMGGGGLLNPLLIEAVRAGQVSAQLRQRFTTAAESLAARPIVGYGEITTEHFSLGTVHPYMSAPADHPLLLLLSDIAAKHNLPIDLHMEAIERPADLDPRYRSPPNPASLMPNIAAFERLLAHNRQTRIVWAHGGWDNTGQRTPALMRRLLATHPNLFISLKMGPDSLPLNRPYERGLGLDPEWSTLLIDRSDRFLIGTDQFFVAPNSSRRFPQHPGTGRTLLDALPEEVARRIGIENPLRVFPRLRS